MPTVSEQLRRAREAQKLDVYQVAEITKIKTDHIRALESGTFDTFSAPVYIRGFVRTYGKVLKIEEAGLMGQLEVELGQSAKFREPPPLTARQRTPLDFIMLQLSKLNWRLVGVGAAILLVLLIVVVWLRGRKTMPADPLRNLGPGLYQPKPDQSGDTLPLPSAPPPRRP
jgi:cytoskeletal protein RodZ